MRTLKFLSIISFLIFVQSCKNDEPVEKKQLHGFSKIAPLDTCDINLFPYGLYTSNFNLARLHLFQDNIYTWGWDNCTQFGMDSGTYKRSGDTILLFSCMQLKADQYADSTYKIYYPQTGAKLFIDHHRLYFEFNKALGQYNPTKYFSKCDFGNGPVSK